MENESERRGLGNDKADEKAAGQTDPPNSGGHYEE